MSEIVRIRREIDKVDENLLSVLKTRLELARKLGRIKKTQGLPIHDPKREQAILRKVLKTARAKKLPQRQVQQVFLQSFRMATKAQTQYNIDHELQGRSVLIAGGTGGMGRLFATILADQGASVKIFGRSTTLTSRVAKEIGVLPGSYSDAASANIVLVAVPIDATSDVSLRLGSMMKPEGLLADLASVKTGIADAIARGAGPSEYVSLHPLFGPDVTNLEGQQIAAIPYRSGPLWRRLVAVFKHEGARVLLTTVREHDAAMAKIQALHHFAIISLGVALGKSVGKFSTRSWRTTRDQLRRIVENWDTVVGIQERNPFADHERELFSRVVARIRSMDGEDANDSFRILSRYVQNWSRKQ